MYEIDRGNPKYTTFTKLVQVRNFITFELKVIRHEERETQSFYADYFWGYSTWGERDTIFLCWLLLHRQLSTQPTRGARCAQIRLASVGPESNPSRSDARTQLTAFSQIPKSSAHASGAWRHSHPLVPIPIWDFYFDISEWHILSARAWTPAFMLHLTNPCAKRKVLSLTKPKGKIYKTKPLCNYITMGDITRRLTGQHYLRFGGLF